MSTNTPIENDGTDGLTDEERIALAAPDDEDKTATQGELEARAGLTTTEEEDANAKTDPPGADDVGAAAADVPAAAAAPADSEPAAAAAAATDEPGATPSAPIFVAEAPADAAARLAEISTKKADLRKQYDDGDITFDEYDSKKDLLAKDEREIERAVDKAQISAEMQEQQRLNEWYATCATFVKENGYNNPRQQRALDQEVRDVAGTEEGKTMTGPQILALAHANLIEAGMVQAAKPAKPGPAPAKDLKLPPNLAIVPAASGNDPGEGRFASLDRLMTTNPVAYEEALSKLSEADQDAYLRQQA